MAPYTHSALIDYAAIAANLKILLGYSDVTALLNAIQKLTGLVTFHGPIARQTFTDYTYSAFRSVLIENTADLKLAPPPPFEAAPGRVEREKSLTRAGTGFGFWSFGGRKPITVSSHDGHTVRTCPRRGNISTRGRR